MKHDLFSIVFHVLDIRTVSSRILVPKYFSLNMNSGPKALIHQRFFNTEFVNPTQSVNIESIRLRHHVCSSFLDSNNCSVIFNYRKILSIIMVWTCRSTLLTKTNTEIFRKKILTLSKSET